MRWVAFPQFVALQRASVTSGHNLGFPSFAAKLREVLIPREHTTTEAPLIFPEDVANVIDIETIGTWRGDLRNPYSQAVGLLQWTPASCQALHTTDADMAQLTPFEQLDYVGWTYDRLRPQLSIARDQYENNTLPPWVAYLAIFMPSAIGKSMDTVLAVKGEPIYEQNPGMPHKTPGVLMVQDVADMAHRHYVDSLAAWGFYDDQTDEVTIATKEDLDALASEAGFDWKPSPSESSGKGASSGAVALGILATLGIGIALARRR